MKKDRSLAQLLRALKKEMRRSIKEDLWFTGMCHSITDMDTTAIEEDRIERYLDLNRPRECQRQYYEDAYWWPLGELKHRIDWINKELRMLKTMPS